MASLLRRLRRPTQNALLQIQWVKFKYRRRVPFTLIAAGAVALVLFVPLPERLLSPEAQKMLSKNQNQSNFEYGEVWQIEHQRLRQIARQGENTESMVEAEKTSARPGVPKAALFIPLTWLRRRQTEYYKASDPEWLAFMALNKAKQQELKLRLCKSICKGIGDVRQITDITGQPLKVQAYWLDFEFPLEKAIEHERFGVLWMDNQLVWATRRYDDRETKRLNRVFVPMAIFSSLQAMSSSLLTSHFQSAKSRWFEVENPDRQTSVDPSVRGSTNESKCESKLETQKQAKTSSHGLSSIANISTHSELIRNIILLPETEPRSQIVSAAREFKVNFVKQWYKGHMFFPRGGCILKGEIGFVGPKGRYKLHVRAVYVPKTDAFFQIQGSVINLQKHRQSPLGKSGPKTRPKASTSPKSEGSSES